MQFASQCAAAQKDDKQGTSAGARHGKGMIDNRSKLLLSCNFRLQNAAPAAGHPG